MTIEELYDYIEKIGLLTFSTIHDGEVHSRIAHFNGYDDEGLYFRTMGSKPYGRQLKETGKLTVCGQHGRGILNHENVGDVPLFAPGFTLRIIGEVRLVPAEEIFEKAKTNKFLEVAARDITAYPAMADGNFIMHKAKCEIYDYDFEKEHRPYKLHRTRFAFGGATFNEAGVYVNHEECIACGICEQTCSFDAIIPGDTYSVNPERCDDCGSCRLECPTGAIKLSKTF